MQVSLGMLLIDMSGALHSQLPTPFIISLFLNSFYSINFHVGREDIALNHAEYDENSRGESTPLRS